jgi:hypothetical protein
MRGRHRRDEAGEAFWTNLVITTCALAGALLAFITRVL